VSSAIAGSPIPSTERSAWRRRTRTRAPKQRSPQGLPRRGEGCRRTKGG
jgi:hypothetical protein